MCSLTSTILKNLTRNSLLYLTIGLLLLIIFTFVIWPILKVVSFAQLESFLGSIYKFTLVPSCHSFIIYGRDFYLSCTFVAFIFAYTIARLEVPFKGLFKFITILPIVSPPFIVGMSYILLFGRQGIISKQLLNLNVRCVWLAWSLACTNHYFFSICLCRYIWSIKKEFAKSGICCL